MSSFISSNKNRFYVAQEPSFGEVAAITADNRFPANKLEFRQSIERARRPDKTGTRTYLGQDGTGRKHTSFHISSYLTCWTRNETPHYGPLFMSAIGREVTSLVGNTVESTTETRQKRHARTN